MITNRKIERKLTPAQERSIPFIIDSISFTEASKKAKVTKGTITRWMKQSYFQEALRDKREEVFQIALSKLKGASKKAVIKLIELLNSKDENVTRLSAIALLNFSLKADEHRDLLERIERIEEMLEKRIIS